MLPSARIVVVDDNRDDLQAIVDGLQSLGAPALGLHYPHYPGKQGCQAMRILFLDLYLAGVGSDQIKNTVGVLSSLLTGEQGPYAIVLWSDHAAQQAEFETACRDRLPKEGLPTPMQVLALEKVDYLETTERGRVVKEPPLLMKRILERIESIPQLAALLAWEEQVSRAADDTICQIFQIARRAGDPCESLAKCLGDLAVASAGPKIAEENVFRAVNEVLVPVLADRLLHRGGGSMNDLWRKAVPLPQKNPSFSAQDKASWNRLLHVEMGDGACRPWERGSLISLTAWSEEKFLEIWGSQKKDIFQGLSLEPTDPQADWLMVQVQAACDHAQQNPGLLPFLLGRKLPASQERWWDSKKSAQYLWLSPTMVEGKETWRLIVNLRYLAGLPRPAVVGLPVLGRLREQLLTNLTHRVHSYGGRPGIVEF